MSTISTVSSYVKTHEKLLMAALFIALSWFTFGKIENVVAAHDNANLAQAKVIATQDAAKTAAVAAQVAQDAAQYQALALKLDAQNASLVAANAQLATALSQRQKTDATLPPTELASRWNTLVPNAGVSITNGQATLPTTGAVATVQQLELIPAQQEELKNTQQELNNAQSLVSAEGQSITTLNTEVVDLRAQMMDNQKVCTAQVAVVKAEARRSKRRWFYAGVIIGFIGRQLIKTETGF